MYLYEISLGAAVVQSFSYTADQLSALEKAVSAERLAPYRVLAGGDPVRILRLYESNTALSESFYSALQGLEITLRNRVDRALASGLGRTDWYDAGMLHPEQEGAPPGTPFCF